MLLNMKQLIGSTNSVYDIVLERKVTQENDKVITVLVGVRRITTNTVRVRIMGMADGKYLKASDFENYIPEVFTQRSDIHASYVTHRTIISPILKHLFQDFNQSEDSGAVMAAVTAEETLVNSAEDDSRGNGFNFDDGEESSY
jgi:hypothetical protein